MCEDLEVGKRVRCSKNREKAHVAGAGGVGTGGGWHKKRRGRWLSKVLLTLGLSCCPHACITPAADHGFLWSFQSTRRSLIFLSLHPSVELLLMTEVPAWQGASPKPVPSTCLTQP